MKRYFLPVFLLAFLAFAACSDDATIPPAGGGSVAEIDLDPEGPGFEMVLEFAAGPDSLHRGPFLLKGTKPIWAGRWQGLLVDFTLTNIGETDQLVPVSLEFLRFIPEDVELAIDFDVENKYLFDFEDGDGWWVPGEESLPKKIVFQVDPNQSVGFSAQIGLGERFNSWIRGQTWKDLDRDGIHDEDEYGLAYCTLGLEDVSAKGTMVEVRTNSFGEYDFSDVPWGTYELRVLTHPSGWESTTGTTMHMVVTNPWGPDDGVTGADFGFVQIAPE